jgi:hypothetical protein
MNKLEDSECLNEDETKIEVKFFYDIGWYPTLTWNIKEIILECVESERSLCDSEKRFLVTDISNNNIFSILNVVNYDIRLLLKLCSELDQLVQAKDFRDMQEYESDEEEKRLDLEWVQANDDDACDNCGYARSRKHDCDCPAEWAQFDYQEDEIDIPKDINYFVGKIVSEFESMKDQWVKDGFEVDIKIRKNPLEKLDELIKDINTE